jgi:outer membrane protein OmpA-like peptidoglycan-associated protein
MMRAGLHIIAIAAALALAAPTHAQAPSRDDIVKQLSGFESTPELDLPALRQQVMERARTRSRNDPGPVNRPPIAPDLRKVAGFNVAIQFDDDTPIIQPGSYQTVGRIADALVHASLLPYTFLIVGHVESTGKREANVILSQRRADALRDVLVNTFKISPKRIVSIGLGEEQLLEPARPSAPANGQTQIITWAKVAEETPATAPANPAPAPAKKTGKKR